MDILTVEEDSTALFRNVGYWSPIDAASSPRRRETTMIMTYYVTLLLLQLKL